MNSEQQKALALARARRLRAEAQANAPKHPEFDPANVPGGVPGYDPATGNVTRQFGKTESGTYGAIDTLTFGFGDEVASSVGSALSGVPREQVLSEIRGNQTGAQEQNPGSYMAGQVVGGVAQGVATAPYSLTANLTTRGAPILNRMLAGAGDGLIAGGLYGAGSGTDAGSRATEALKTGVAGGLIGGAFPVASDMIGRGYQGFRNWRNAGNIAQQAGVADPNSLRILGRTMEADGTLGPRGQANMARAGNEAMVADAGPNARGLLDYSIQRGGPGSTIAREAVEGRVTRSSHQLTRTLDDALGAPQGVGSAQNAIRDAAQPQVSQAYQRAYAAPIDYASQAGRSVEDVIDRIPPRIARNAIERANELMRYDRMPRQIMANIADDGAVTFREMPGVVQADYIKRALDQIAQDGIDPITGRMDSGAAFASRIARDLRNAVGDAVPAYREALETAADPLSQQSAVRIGTGLTGMTRDEFGMAVEGMTRPERQAVLQGFRSKIDDQMAAVTRAMSDGNMDAREAIKGLRELSSRQARTNLEGVMDPAAARQLFDEIDQVTASFELRAGVANNSLTASRQATERMVDDQTGLGVVGTAARGEPLNATKRIAQSLSGYTDDYLRGQKDAVYTDIARLLTRQGGAGQAVYDGVTNLSRTDQATQLMTDRISRALLSGQRLTYPAATQLTPDTGSR